ncbi:MAG: inositol monophosphatase family protein [Pseudobdellovibrionaceae bacterium]
MTTSDRKKTGPLLDIALQAVRKGRECLMSYYGNLSNVQKKHLAGLVSEADQETEKVIQKYLKEHTPQFGFLGEESDYSNQNASSGSGLNSIQQKDDLWILDPLDGTTNFIHQFPIFCISLGLKTKGQLKVGVIDVPILQETYAAEQNCGAFVNGRSMFVSKTSLIEDSFLATGFFAEDEKPLEEQLRIFSDIVRKARAIRRPGAAAYDLCQVARGVFDGFWERNLKPWDVAAGVLLVREAGGVAINYQGQEFDVFDNSLIAGNKAIAGKIQNCVVGNLSGT